MAGAAVAKKAFLIAMLAALAVGIAYPVAAWASQAIAYSKSHAPAAGAAGQQAASDDDDEDLVEKLQKAANGLPDLEELGKALKAMKGHEDRKDREKDFEGLLPKLILSTSVNITNSSVANVTPGAKALLVTTGKGGNLSMILLVMSSRHVYHVRASNVSYSFSGDGSTLTLQGIIERSTLPGFTVNATITASLKIGSAAISSGSSSISGNTLNLIMHRR